MASAKVCTTCLIEKLFSDFHKAGRSRDGLVTQCKSCVRQAGIVWRAVNADRKKATQRALYETDRERIKAKSAAWYRENRERGKAARRAWSAAHADDARRRASAWYHEHTEHVKQAARAWQQRNPERYRVQHLDSWQQYHARKMAAFDAPIDRRVIWERDKGLCGICGGSVPFLDMHIDHIIPLSKGGRHSPESVQCSHGTCNQRKGARLPT